MAKPIELSLLKTLGLVPKDTRKITEEAINNKTISLTQFEKLTTAQRVLESRIVVCDNPEWVALHATGCFSTDSKGYIWKTAVKNRMISQHEFNGSELMPLNVKPLIKISEQSKFKEEQTMEINKENLGDLLGANANIPVEQLLEQKVAEAGAPGAITAFTAEEKEERKKRTAETYNTIKTAISANTTGVDLADTITLRAFNQKYGSIVGYLMSSDKKVVASAPKKIVTIGGKAVLDEANVDQAVKDAYKAGQKVSQKALLKQPTLGLREAAPSGMLGMILEVPAGGVVDLGKLRTPGQVTFDESKKDTVIFTKGKDQSAFLILSLFGEKIRENELTHANPGVLNVRNDVSISKKTGKPVVKTIFKASNRKRLLTSTNYIPRKTYKTVPFSEIIKDEKLQAEANKSLFFNFFIAGEKGTKHSMLEPVSQSRISLENGKYSSEYLKANGIDLGINSFEEDGAPVSNPQIPLRRFDAKKSGEGEKASYIVFDILKQDAELADLNPENDPRFAGIKKALGTKKTFVECFKDVVKSKAAGAAKPRTRVTLSSDEALKTLINASVGETANIDVEGSMQRDEFTKLREEIAAMTV